MKEVNFSDKKLKKTEEFVNRIEILQDFDFPVTAGSLKVSNDGNYVFATGIYPPKMKIFDLNEMSLKCERNFDSEIRKFEVKYCKIIYYLKYILIFECEIVYKKTISMFQIFFYKFILIYFILKKIILLSFN